ILLTLPAAVASIAYIFRIQQLLSHGTKHNLGYSWAIYGPSQLVAFAASTTLVTRAVALSNQDGGYSPTAMTATLSMLIAWALTLVVNHLEPRYKIRASPYVSAYSAISLLTAAITTRTLHDTSTVSTQPQFHAFAAFLACNLLHLIIEASPRGRTKVQQQSPASRYDKANLFSRLSFHFLQHVVSTGYKRPLALEDVDGLMPGYIRTEHSYPHLAKRWEQHVAKRRAKGREPPSLWRLIMVAYARQWGWVLALCLGHAGMMYVSPQLLGRLLDFIQSYKVPQTAANGGREMEKEPEPLALGVILAFGLFVASLTVTFVSAQYHATTTNLGIEIRTALVAMVYRKSLRLSAGAKVKSTAGEITNHMSVDAERWAQATGMMPMVISVPFEIAIAIWLLYLKIGWSIFIGLGSIVLTLPFHAFMAKLFQRIKSAKLEAMDSRLRLVSEVLSGIKIVKLYNWENSFKEKLTAVRGREVKVIRHMGYIFSVMTVIFTTTPLVIALVSFSVYATVGGPNFSQGEITPQVIFVSTSLFGLLSRPVSMLSQIMNQVISADVATRRIERFLLAEEIEDTVVEREEERGQDTPVIEVKGGVFAWCSKEPEMEADRERKSREKNEAKKHQKAEKAALKAGKLAPDKPEMNKVEDKSPTLVDINMQIVKGSLTAVVGRVGQGKTSLLSAIIGDMYKRQGAVRIRGQVTYAAQQPWIVNATLRDNIVFGLEFDAKKYDYIIHVCGLSPDIDMLPAGDQTEIGERGINLSGGQKQRVSLARAAYQDADVYLLDDPLSAVDAHVDQHLWENLIGPNGLLKSKTRILVTHGIHHLEHVDQIVVVKDGRITENGHYDDLMAAKGAFRQLIDEYSVNARKDKKKLTESSTSLSRDSAMSETKASGVASLVTKNSSKEEEVEGVGKKDDKLVQDEKMESGSVAWNVYKIYLRAASYRNSFITVFMFIAAQGCQISTNIWLQHWTNVAPDSSKNDPAMFLGVYAALIAVFMVATFFVTYVVMVIAGLRACQRLHEQLLASVMHLPMSFFDTTPLGRIVNRFSSDVFACDDAIPWAFMSIMICVVSVSGTVIVIAVSTPAFLALVPPLSIAFVLIQMYYIRSSRALKRIDSIARSPVYQHFSETLSGVSTIRAMGAQERFVAENALKTDASSTAYFTYLTSNRWLQIRLEALGAMIVLSAALFAVLSRETLSPSMVGLALSYSLTVTEDVTWMVRSFCDLQNSMVSVERIHEYVQKNPEAPPAMALDESLPEKWPSEGRVEFRNYSTRYRQGLDLVIKNISFEVQPAEKVGIVGRTGAGKSSLTLALFRIVEAANSHWARASHNGEDMDADPSKAQVHGEDDEGVDLEKMGVGENGGSIWIDGVDISTVGLSRLRKQLAIIPQDPTLFAGTVRENLDPFDELQDADLWEALERAHLKEHIASLAGGLSFMVSQNGDNFSVGQRSLICLARALLRKTKILVLDEATAAVDVETDELIQKTIRKEFKDRTILTIAHRIKTVMDSDKILVLEKGRVEEFEAPKTLLQRPSSLFYNLAHRAGEIKDSE
ncbi:hypothetical protein BGZ93_010781, partial [Podila epicladia]